MPKYDIIEVDSKADLDNFIKVQFDIYRGNPNWVPQLISESRKFFDRRINPFFQHSEAKFFLARKNGQAIARIAGIINNRHNKFNEEKTGFFGFFECPDDQGLANELFGLAAEYARTAGMDTIRGPANYSSNDDWGWLLDAYDSPPVFQMPYNHRYYLKLAENYGFVKSKDLIAYFLDDSVPIPEKALKIDALIRRKYKLTIRPVEIKKLESELQIVREIYNKAWRQNWGFVPLTEEEIDHVADDFRKIMDPNIIFLAFAEDQPAAFSLTLPDINHIFRKMKGRLFPFGIFHFLWHTKIKKISATGVRMLAMGVIPEYQKRGIDNMLYIETYRRGIARGYHWAECSWILEDNKPMNNSLLALGATPYKHYRLYEKKL
jgi:GNAT superfamily N-acetyltransferase